MNKKYELIRPRTHEEWLDVRKQGIGSSEVATILGLNPFDTPYQLWLRKRGMIDPVQETFIMKAGHYLEPAVAQFFADETGAKIQKSSEGDFIVRDTEFSFMQVSPDRYFRLNGVKGICECKTTQLHIDEDDLPKHWYVQLQYQMGVNRITHGALAWLTQGREFGYGLIKADRDLFKFIKERVCEFWTKNIVEGIEPDIYSSEDISYKFKTSAGTDIMANEEMLENIVALRKAKERLKEAESDAKAIELLIKTKMGENERIVSGSGDILATWKNRKDGVRTFQLK